jgi:hypothetical protein
MMTERKPTLLPRAAAVSVTTILALSACRLVDQRTFAPAPGPSPAAVVAVPPLESRAPLMTVAPGTNLANYRGLIRATAAAAEARDPSVRFDVIAVVPATGSISAQVAAAEAARSQAAQVAQELVVAGMAPARINLRTSTDAHASRADVRIYVR